MKPFPKLHLWLIIPFVVTLAGFNGYWTGFTEASFQWHLHGLSATSWYIILIVQPWIYQNKPIQVHRKVGMVGLLLAGIVVASALSVIKGNLSVEDGPIFPIRYSLLFIDILTVFGFYHFGNPFCFKRKEYPSPRQMDDFHCLLGIGPRNGPAVFSPAWDAVSTQRIL